jgi:hypothetical protein
LGEKCQGRGLITCYTYFVTVAMPSEKREHICRARAQEIRQEVRK